jgi:predicted RNA polymerase sigma factor
VRFELPPEEDRPAALDTVHTSLYLLFNEGYLSTSDKPILRELCRDAMLLARLLVDESSLANSQTVALLALMCLTTARFDARIDDDGRLVPLDQQDRSRWDRSLIRQGYDYLARSSTMEAVAATRFHLEAAIAARHCEAATFDQTDWRSISSLYDRLFEIDPSPMVELNRAVAISYRDGPQTAIPLVETIRLAGRMPHSHVVAAVLANLYARAGLEEPARRFLDEALARARTEHERELIALQIGRAQP